MSNHHERNIAVFLDFDNVAIGARDAHQRFDIHIVLERLLEKGRVLVKKAYADWSYYQDYMVDLHGAAIELIEVPSPRYSGKNSADIRLVVDAMDLCYTNQHVDTYVIVSGDSDFSPLVSKLRENNKEVIGLGLKASTSELLISNCDEFIFYDDLVQGPISIEAVNLDKVPTSKKKLFNLLVTTIEGLVREHRGALYSSLIKDTMKRKKPDFNESNWGYRSFSELLDDAMNYGLLTAERDEKAGGTLVVTAVGGTPAANTGGADTGSRRSSRRRRRRSSSRARGAEAGEATVETTAEATAAADGEKATAEAEAELSVVEGTAASAPTADADAGGVSAPPAEQKRSRRSRRRSKRTAATAGTREEPTAPEGAPAADEVPPPAGTDAEPAAPAAGDATPESAGKAVTKKKATKKTTTKKAVTKKKTTTKKATTKKATKKAATKKTATKKTTAKKTATKKAATKKTTKKTTTKKAATKKASTRKAATGKTTESAAPQGDDGGDVLA